MQIVTKVISLFPIAIACALQASIPAASYADISMATSKMEPATSQGVWGDVTYQTVAVDGISVFYRAAGPIDASVVLLRHGYPSSSHMFRDLIPLLAEDYRVIAPDMVGSGATDTSPMPKSTC